MSKGWMEYRLEQDGRWQPTGNLRDAFPFGVSPISAVQVSVPAEEPRDFYRVDGLDSSCGLWKAIFVAGKRPEGDPELHTLGWTSFSRP